MMNRFSMLVRHQSSVAKTGLLPRPFTSKSYIFPSLESVKAEELLGKPFGAKTKTYFVSRTSNGYLPVYRNYKRLVPHTEIRRVEGDVVQLRNEIQQALPEISPKDFNVVIQSSKIVIRGDYVEPIKELLAHKF